jgi:hypothetical protein
VAAYDHGLSFGVSKVGFGGPVDIPAPQGAADAEL